METDTPLTELQAEMLRLVGEAERELQSIKHDVAQTPSLDDSADAVESPPREASRPVDARSVPRRPQKPEPPRSTLGERLAKLA